MLDFKSSDWLTMGHVTSISQKEYSNSRIVQIYAENNSWQDRVLVGVTSGHTDFSNPAKIALPLAYKMQDYKLPNSLTQSNWDLGHQCPSDEPLSMFNGAKI